MNSAQISQLPSGIGPKSRVVLLRVPALRESGQVVFPGIGPMTDEEFIELVGDALQSGYRVYVKDLAQGQAAVPIIKTDGKVSLGVSSEFRAQVEQLRLNRKRETLPLPRPG
jgi:hypothetical protein